MSTALRVRAEIAASDVSLLVTFNNAIGGVIQNNPKARANPKALAHLDGYKRSLVSSLSGNLQRFEMEKSRQVESLQEIIAEMAVRIKPLSNRSRAPQAKLTLRLESIQEEDGVSATVALQTGVGEFHPIRS